MDIETDLKATEDPDKLKEHVRNIATEAQLIVKPDEGKIEGQGEFERLWDKAKEQRIRTTLWDELKNNKTGSNTHVELDKIAASAGQISIYTNSSLGKIKIEVPWEEVEKHEKEIDLIKSNLETEKHHKR